MEHGTEWGVRNGTWDRMERREWNMDIVESREWNMHRVESREWNMGQNAV